MFSNIRKLLGLGDFEVELLCSDKIDLSSKTLQGAIKIKSRKDNVLIRTEMQLIEDFKKGRGNDKKETELVWSLQNLDLDVYLPSGEFVVVPFRLEFEPILSNMDRIGNNFILRGPVKIAKYIKGVSSTLRLDIRCCVRGVEASPIISKRLTY